MLSLQALCIILSHDTIFVLKKSIITIRIIRVKTRMIKMMMMMMMIIIIIITKEHKMSKERVMKWTRLGVR
jgi:hypothetical protein